MKVSGVVWILACLALAVVTAHTGRRGSGRAARLTMRHLWAPWRMDYVTDEARGLHLLRGAGSTGEDQAHVLYRGEHCCHLNRYPYNSGHLMVVPLRAPAGFHGAVSQHLSQR